MPINAGYEYAKALDKHQKSRTIEEKIKALEEMLRTAPKHKGSETLLADIKQKLSKYRGVLEKQKTQKGKGYQLSIKKKGFAEVVLTGIANSGKSLLLSKLTNAKPEVAEYEFTTVEPEEGMADIDGVQIQIVELPAITEDFAYKGRGPLFFSIARNADLIVFVLDATKNTKDQKKFLFHEFEKAHIKLGEQKPPLKIKKVISGGITFVGENLFRGDIREAVKTLRQKGMNNAVIEFYGPVTLQQLDEATSENIVYLPLLCVENKCDIASCKNLKISAKKEEGIEKLKKGMWEKIGMIRLFTKSPGKEKDWPPIAIKKGSIVKDLASTIHKDFIKKFRFARVWGKSVAFSGSKVGLGHILADNDIVEFHLK